MVYLTLEDIQGICDHLSMVATKRIEIMSPNGLMSALAAPRRSAFGAEVFATLAEKAGALVYALVQNHPFWDGNKRIASAALRLFVERNGARLDADDLDLRVVTTGVAKGALRSSDLVAWLAQHLEADTKWRSTV